MPDLIRGVPCGKRWKPDEATMNPNDGWPVVALRAQNSPPLPCGTGVGLPLTPTQHSRRPPTTRAAVVAPGGPRGCSLLALRGRAVSRVHRCSFALACSLDEEPSLLRHVSTHLAPAIEPRAWMCVSSSIGSGTKGKRAACTGDPAGWRPHGQPQCLWLTSRGRLSCKR